MSGFDLFLQWWQAFAFFPVIEASGLFAAVEPGCVAAQMSKGIGLQLFMQQLSNNLSYFLRRETGRVLFPPGASLASGTRLQST